MTVRIRMLGGFEVTVDDVPVPVQAWARRHAAWLVQLLALSRGRRLHREQVVEALWPGLSLDAAGPRLHKAAHYARRALGAPDAVVLRNDVVALWPGAFVRVDVEEFLQAAKEALASGTTDAAVLALDGVRRSAPSRRPLSAVDRADPRRGARPAPRPVAPGRPVGGGAR